MDNSPGPRVLLRFVSGAARLMSRCHAAGGRVRPRREHNEQRAGGRDARCQRHRRDVTPPLGGLPPPTRSGRHPACPRPRCRLGLAVPAAAEHRIGPLLWRALAAADALEELGPLRPALGGAADAYRMEALLLLPRSVALAVGPLTGTGLEPVVLKGPAVAARYPEPGLRPMEDIDLLLPDPTMLGPSRPWAAPAGGGTAGRAGSLRHGADPPDVPTLLLELHYGLEGMSQRVTSLDAEELWRRAGASTAPARRPTDSPRPKNSSCWPRTPASPTTASSAWSGSPTWR